MEVSLRRAQTDDRPAVEALLNARELPLEGLDAHFEHFWVADAGGKVVGTAGLEVHGRLGLFRSLAVDPDSGGAGVGSRLTWQLLEEAVSLGLREVFLLTTTAVEFAACPATATAMRWSPTASGVYEPPTVI